MQLEDIQELGRAAIALKIIADQLTDEVLKVKTLNQASLVMDAHDELLATHRIGITLDTSAAKLINEMEEKKDESH